LKTSSRRRRRKRQRRRGTMTLVVFVVTVFVKNGKVIPIHNMKVNIRGKWRYSSTHS
jgi:hypothetical protein